MNCTSIVDLLIGSSHFVGCIKNVMNIIFFVPCFIVVHPKLSFLSIFVAWFGNGGKHSMNRSQHANVEYFL